ncbi:unnamed protein product [Meganyctiphanes norvegica]|uniref:Uncharacterized protein n=1 Tax=Meganyctiphanes norvegica TaxID=48144 RepID=A0AAV2RSS7_MEGNR
MLPSEASLVFMELTLGSAVQRRMYIRLDKTLPNTRGYMVELFTGQRGPTFRGIKFDACNSYKMYTGSTLPFSKATFTFDKSGGSIAKHGDVIGWLRSGYLQHIFFYVSDPSSTLDFGKEYTSECIVFGHVDEGSLDVLKACHDNHSRGVTISDCGLVLEC